MSKRKALSRAEQWRLLEEEEADKKEKDKDKDYEVEEVSELEEEFQPTGEVAESPASLQTLHNEAELIIQKPATPATPTPPSTPTPTPPTTPIPSRVGRPTSSKKPPQHLMTPLKPTEIEAVHRQQLEGHTKVGFYLMLTFFRR